MVPRSLYVHVPFCPSICPYCDFHKMLRNEGLVARYLDRLEQEIAGLAERFPGPLETVYFGGGTPSHLSDAELARVFAAIARAWGGVGSRETTLEADPLTFDAARLKLFAELGVTRLSIGLQSTQDDVLRFLGRLHDSVQGQEAVALAVASGMRVNVDVMTAIEGQDLELDLRRVVGLGVRHVSVYSLTIEPNTPFGMRGVRVDEELDASTFARAAEVLGELGLRRYEVSNHAAPGDESQHNLGYWRGNYYLAVGPGASAYLPPAGQPRQAPLPADQPRQAPPSADHHPTTRDQGTRSFGTRVKNPPIKGWLLGAPPEVDELGAHDVVLERLMTGLRTSEGVDLIRLERDTGVSVEAHAPAWLHDTTTHGLLTLGDDRTLKATTDGLTRLDAVLRAFVATRG